MVTVTFIVLGLWALLPSSDASAYSGDITSYDYSLWFYRWFRGGAWMPHEERHECFGLSSHCTFLAPNDTQVANYTLAVNTTIIPHLAFVEVTFATNAIEHDDIVAVYLVEAEEANAIQGDPLSDFIDYVYATDSLAIDLERHAIVFGPFLNMRASYQLKYLRKVKAMEFKDDGLEGPIFAVLGTSPVLEMERGHTEPLQIRLALTENTGEMRVMWVSGQVGGPHVEFGLASANALHRRANATFATYDALDQCELEATTRSSVYFRHPGSLYDAVLTGLVPGSTYRYRVGSDTGVASPELEFRFPIALREPTDETQRPQSFFVFGDLGTRVFEKPRVELGLAVQPERHFNGLDRVSRLAKWGDERTVMERIRQDLDESLRPEAGTETPEYAALIHIGDISYAVGSTYIWEQFGAVVQSVASRLPYMVGVGNHEYDYLENGAGHDPSGSEAALSNGWHPENGSMGADSKGECGVPYARRFHMPKGMEEGAKSPFWYSFRIGLTHHIVLSSEHRCASGSSMREWLERELRNQVDRSVTPWLIVHIHRPLYCSEDYEADHHVAKVLQDCFDDLFATNNVDFVFSGHYHAYERTCPVYKDECRERDGKALAPTHIMIGSGGAELDDISYLQAPWSRSRQQDYGYGRLQVYNASHAFFDFVRTRDRAVTDALWVVSNHSNVYKLEN